MGQAAKMQVIADLADAGGPCVWSKSAKMAQEFLAYTL